MWWRSPMPPDGDAGGWEVFGHGPRRLSVYSVDVAVDTEGFVIPTLSATTFPKEELFFFGKQGSRSQIQRSSIRFNHRSDVSWGNGFEIGSIGLVRTGSNLSGKKLGSFIFAYLFSQDAGRRWKADRRRCWKHNTNGWVFFQNLSGPNHSNASLPRVFCRFEIDPCCK